MASTVLKAGQAKRLLVAGADPAVTKKDLIHRLGGSAKLVNCCVDLGSESVDTRSNAEEASRWLARHRYRSFRLITSDWHMRRARYDFRQVLGDRYTIVPDAVRSRAAASSPCSANITNMSCAAWRCGSTSDAAASARCCSR